MWLSSRWLAGCSGVPESPRVFIGMETSGVTRRAFELQGFEVFSCDLLPSLDAAPNHMQCDVFDALDQLRARGWWPDLAIFHPTCTYLTASAEWAYKDGPYHQKVKPGTLVGIERRDAREVAIAHVLRLYTLPVKRIAIENPVGVLSSRWRKPDQIIQPWMFGDDASKATCLWLKNLPVLIPTDPLRPPRLVADAPFAGQAQWKVAGRYANQTDSGQSNVTPSDDRWQERSETYPGVSAAFAQQWGAVLRG